MMTLLFAALFAGGDADACGSYLYQPAYCIDEILRGPARPYCPQPGDILLATDNNPFWKITHNLGGTGHPHHTGVVFARPDGTMAVLEGGPYDTARIRILDALPHMRCYENIGRIWIRQRKTPLTPEQSARLTEFALCQDGKWFALGRLGGQLTIFRTRGPVRTYFVGKPHGPNRFSYFCSECATEAIVYAGLVDPANARPSATYPRDIFMDHSPNPFLNRNFKLCECWYPPARFTACPVTDVVGPPAPDAVQTPGAEKLPDPPTADVSTPK
jgi:hypothetical protein